MNIKGLAGQFGDKPTSGKKVIYLSIVKNIVSGGFCYGETRPAHWLYADEEDKIVLSGNEVEYRVWLSQKAPVYRPSRDECAYVCIQHSQGLGKTVVVDLRE